MTKKKYALALDIGGTKIEACVINNNGKIIHGSRFPTGSPKKKEIVMSNIISAAKTMLDLAKQKNQDILGIGVSYPGFLDKQGRIYYGGGTLWSLEGINLKKRLEKQFSLPVFYDNDANCFALTEALLGAGKKKNIVVGIIWGTGIGSGIVIDKKIYSGKHGGAGEFGHCVVDYSLKKGHRCSCGHYGCVENLASGKAISRRYEKMGGKIKNASPKEIFHSKEKIAKIVLDEAYFYLSLGLSFLVNIINPDIIVLGGGVSNLPDMAYKRIQNYVMKYSNPQNANGLKIIRHKISDSEGVIGAAMLVFENMK